MGADESSKALERAAELPLYHWRRGSSSVEGPRYHWRRARRQEPPQTLVRVDSATKLLDARAVDLRLTPLRHLVALTISGSGIAALWWLSQSREGVWIVAAPQVLIPLAMSAWRAGRTAIARLRTTIDRWRARPALSAQETDEGEWVRITGRVVEGVGFRSAAGSGDSVLAHYLGGLGEPMDRDLRTLVETHAVAFQIVAPDREIVHVEIDRAQFVARPVRLDFRLHERDVLASRPVTNHNNRQVAAVVRHEQVIRSGDLVEVTGQLHRELDPTAAGAYRAPVLRRVLRGTARRKLQIRAV